MPRPRFRHVIGALVAGMAVTLLTATAAGAHTVGGVDATNYRTTIRSVSPQIPGLEVHVVENGSRLAVTNTGRRDVVVEGYEGEPYLRVGPRGTFENTRSPALYTNRDLRTPGPVPRSADPEAAPEWRRTGSGTTVRWHDHRAHWMGTEDPSLVQRARGEPHRIQRFTIVLRADDEVVRVRGDVRWVPGPSPWPWIAGAALLVIGTVIAARARVAAVALGSVLAVALGGALVHAVGSWTVATGSLLSRAADDLPTLGAAALGILALVQLRRRGLHAAAPLLVFAGLFLGIAIGLADLAALSKSQLPTDLPFPIDRLAIALALGGGFGVAIGAALYVADRRAPDARRDAAGRDRRNLASAPSRGHPSETENDSHSMMKR